MKKNRKPRKLDRTDRLILKHLQEDGRISNVALARKVNLSATPCHERVRRLERQGYIRGYTALLEPRLVDAALLVFVLPGLYSATARTSAIAEPGAPSTPGIGAPQAGTASLPDIYYIILDGYARADVLEAHFGFDNDPFLTELRKRGFQVASSSAANYNWTFLSLSSSLNMDYVQELLPGQLDPAGSDRTLPYEAIRNNRLSRMLRERGYRFVHLQSTWGATARNPYADEFLPCQSGVFENEYYRAVAESSWLKVMTSKASHDLAQCHLANLGRLKELPESTGPKFVFAHFLPPHHPYLFDRDGNVLRNADITNQFEFQKRLWGRKDQYLDQLRFMNDQVLEVVGALQGRSSVEPIIVIQSDHGPQVLELGVTDAYYAARLRNLIAVSLPGVPGFSLPDDIEPVNLFRVILDARFGTDLPILASRHYISAFATPYDFRPTDSAN